jgi:hypothetical protein
MCDAVLPGEIVVSFETGYLLGEARRGCGGGAKPELVILLELKQP